MLNTTLSAAAYLRAHAVMPSGNTRASNFEAPHPLYLASGDGAYVTDIDGNRYLDFQNNFTALIHGYGHAAVTSVLQRQTMWGLSFANPTLAEIELAEVLCERVPHFEKIRFTNTGSEAVMMAIKAARALTGRPLIAKCEGAYHGNYDAVEINVSNVPIDWRSESRRRRPEHDGLSRSAFDNTIVIPFNDIDYTDKIIDAAGDQLAAILIDPLPSRVGLIPIDPKYFDHLRKKTRSVGALLISDEVLSFRLGISGALGEKGLAADLCAFGKIIGGGLPIGAIAGASDLMAVFDPGHKTPPYVAHSGTFTANPMSLVAGIAAMEAMTVQEFQKINALGAMARKGLKQALAAAAIPGAVTGEGSLFRIFLGRREIKAYADSFEAGKSAPVLMRVLLEMRERGVLLSSVGLGAISTPMQDADIRLLLDVFRQALDVVAPTFND